MNNKIISLVVMGVCGTGKTTIAEALAKLYEIDFIDGDDLHPKSNIEKMSKGFALNDTDRLPWLENIQQHLKLAHQNNQSLIVVCSALKKRYRDILRKDNQPLFIFLNGNKALIEMRLNNRVGHFMKPGMLETQLATLEIPDLNHENDVLDISIEGDVRDIIDRIEEKLLERTICLKK